MEAPFSRYVSIAADKTDVIHWNVELKSLPERGLWMHILILHHYFCTEGTKQELRFFEIGRQLAAGGHQVTVITTNSSLGLKLGQMNIGLLQYEEMAILAFNLAYRPEMNQAQKGKAIKSFARCALRQGRNLPRADLILTVLPPLAPAWPTLSLSKYHDAPFILQVEELEEEISGRQGNLISNYYLKQAVRLEQKTYHKADKIVALDGDIAQALQERGADEDKIFTLPGNLAGKELYHSFLPLIEDCCGAVKKQPVSCR